MWSEAELPVAADPTVVAAKSRSIGIWIGRRDGTFRIGLRRAGLCCMPADREIAPADAAQANGRAHVSR